jgi:hypothetical protein
MKALKKKKGEKNEKNITDRVDYRIHYPLRSWIPICSAHGAGYDAWGPRV